jgi:hypothetical protein
LWCMAISHDSPGGTERLAAETRQYSAAVSGARDRRRKWPVIK